jgi:hypothetical protein
MRDKTPVHNNLHIILKGLHPLPANLETTLSRIQSQQICAEKKEENK